jgi:hypothetical protein
MVVQVLGVAIGVASSVALGCGGSDRAGSSCVASVEWNQTRYFGHALKAPQGDGLGRGVVPACTADGDDQRVIIRRVANVPPALAVAREAEPPGFHRVYLAPGFFPVLADHPLQRLRVGKARDLAGPRRCSGSFRLTGAVLRTPTHSVVRVGVGGRELSVNVVTGTKIVGFRRAGHPYLQRRDLVEVHARRCDLPDWARAYVADDVRPAD